VTLALVLVAATALAAPQKDDAPKQDVAKSPFDLEKGVYVLTVLEQKVGREEVTFTETGWETKGSFDVFGVQKGSFEGSRSRDAEGAVHFRLKTDVEIRGAKQSADIEATVRDGKLEARLLPDGSPWTMELEGKGDPVFYADVLSATLIDLCRELARRVAAGSMGPGDAIDAILPGAPRTIRIELLDASQFARNIAGSPYLLWSFTIRLAGAVEGVLLCSPGGLPLRFTVPSQKAEIVLEGFEAVEPAGLEPKTLVDRGAWRANLSPATHTVTRESGVKIAMRDGVKLAADVFRPEGEGKFPTILVRTPYGRTAEGLTRGNYFARRGYAVVVQDVRGRFESEGEWFPLVHEANDGSDTIDWIAAQPWSDGKVGMIGASYVGWTQWFAARSGNPHLEAIVPQVAPPDPLENIPYEGGAFLLSTGWWAKVTAWLEKEGATATALPKLDWKTVLSTLPLGDLDRALGVEDAFLDEWIAHPPSDVEYWRPYFYQTRYEAMDVAAMHISGWFDGDQPGSLQNFVGMRERAKSEFARKHQYLIMGPWAHAFNVTGKVGGIDCGEEAVVDLDARILRFFDRTLKGVENGIDAEDPVLLFTMGENRWHAEKDWPPAGTRFTNLYLASGGKANRRDGDGSLALEAPAAKDGAPDVFRYDPKDPRPLNVNFEDLTGENTSLDQSNLPDRDDVLDYVSPPLAGPVEITGPIRAMLWVSTDAADTDFTVEFLCRKPDGRMLGYAGGIQRLRYRRGPGTDSPAKPGEVAPIEIDCWATGIRFEKGDRIHVQIASSLWPAYARNLNTLEPLATAKDPAVATNRIFHDAERPSCVVLPVVPREGAPGIEFEK